MPVFTPINIKQSKVHHTEYIRTENKPNDADAKPAEPVNPSTPEAK